MIENGNKKYYTPNELLDFIEDENTELSKAWKKTFPKYENVVLLDQINRVFSEARKNNSMNYIQFKKNKDANKSFYAYAIEDVIDFLVNTYPKNVFDITVHNKGWLRKLLQIKVLFPLCQMCFCRLIKKIKK